MDLNQTAKPITENVPVKWKCWHTESERYAYFTRKSCRYCTPVYANDPDADAKVVR